LSVEGWALSVVRFRRLISICVKTFITVQPELGRWPARGFDKLNPNGYRSTEFS
jgi:hypothetical protein